MYLDYAKDQAKRRTTMTMRDWEDKLDAFLSFNERDILSHAGKISAQFAENIVLERYIEFDTQRRENEKTTVEIEEEIILKELNQRVTEHSLSTKKGK